MTTPEATPRAGEDVAQATSETGPAAELKTALAGFMTEVTTKLKKQDDRMTKLDRKTMYSNARPALSTARELDAPHQKAFNAYLRSGDDDGLRGLEIEGKAMSTAVAADGGYLVSPQAAETIQSVLVGAASIRAIANVVTIDSTSYDVLIDRGDLGAGWATEAAATTETSTPQIERVNIPVFELSAMPKASQRLLDDSAFDVESWLAQRIAEKFARAEADAFINGDGVDKPTGFLTYTNMDNDSWSWGGLGWVNSGDAADLTSGDSLVDMVYALGAQYRAGASFVMNSKTTGVVRKLKDADGRYLWSDGLAAGEPARLMGYPVLVAEDMPDIAADETPIAFGNFVAGYTVAERPDLRVLRDPFSAKPHVLFYATKRVGGAVSDFAAIKLLRIAAS